MADLKIDHSSGTQPYIRIIPDPADTSLYEVLIYEKEDSGLLYDIPVKNPRDNSSVLIQIALHMAKDPHFGFGRDQRPYRWSGSKWIPCQQWFDALGFGLYAAIRATGLTEGAESLYGITRAAWRAHTKYDTEGLNLRAFGTCPGVPLLDGILIPCAEYPDEESLLATDMSTGEFVQVEKVLRWKAEPHDPSHCNLRVLPITIAGAMYSYGYLESEAGQGSKLMNFLYSVLSPAGVIALRDWLGYHLVLGVTANSEKMVYLWGAGANGKSQVLELIRALLGKDACAEVRLSDLTIQANLEKLIGKLAMLGAEANTKSDLETLKALISREPISCNPKYRNPFTVEPQCLITQASNHRPAFETNDDAMVRRVVALEMKSSFKDKEEGRVLNIAQKVLAQEYDLLVAFALKGALACIARNGYEEPDEIKQASRVVVASGNFIKAFAETLEFGPYEIADLELYQAYVQWCADHGIRKVQDSTNFLGMLYSLLAPLNVKVERTRGSGKNYVASRWQLSGSDKEVPVLWSKTPDRVQLFRGFRVGLGWLPSFVGQPIPPTIAEGALYQAQQSLTFGALVSERAATVPTRDMETVLVGETVESL